MASPSAKQEISAQIPPSGISGDFVLPADARGIVLFAHGSGSSRFSSRNRSVAGELQSAGFGTLLLDLLTAPEEATDARTGHLRFDIAFLAERLKQATDWVRQEPRAKDLPLGYFGASTGAAAALLAATKAGASIRAIVSRGGRPDLAGTALPRVVAPTLLIVGGRDEAVLELNNEAKLQLNCIQELHVIPGATHLFEEPGALEEVARLAKQWFERYL
jgi:alpha-beta hydrolase superfamily lysophospholipase